LNPHKNIAKHHCPSRSSKWKVAAVLLAVLVMPLRFAWAQKSDLEQQLQSDYTGKTVTLRHFYSGDHLRFHSDGTPQGNAPIGPWTLDGQIAVEKVQLRGGTLSIKGRRIHLGFDSQRKPQDQLMAIKSSQNRALKDKDLEKILRRLKVEVEIELPTGKPNPKEVSSAIDAVFLTGSESMMDIVPSYWRAYIAQQEGKPAPEPESKEPAYKVNSRGGVSAPHATYMPDPEYSEEARELKYQGTIVISVVVDASGNTRDVQIQRPLGLGLDEKAVAAVSAWKFRPAQKDGEPVSVEVITEVNFRLY
jgi:TonB family protein